MPERTDQCNPQHDPRTCNLCSSLRHPAHAAAGRALTRHLATHPLPRQAARR
ncbi:hypothetical protein ACFW2X_06680 [Streptomyces antibioticus]|uniref:hypothetical protein n=1 Tax=Streptomyces antibioticus TaxID=1890 RepID=UPI0036AD0F5C